LFQLAAALALAVSLAGCGPAETGLQRDAALQERVLGVSQAAAANDHPTALQALDSLEAELVLVSRDGGVSEERRQRILTIITAVRADLAAAIEAAETAAAAKTAAEAAAAEAEKAKADAEAEGKAAQENAAPVVPTPLTEQVPAPERGQGNEEKGNEEKGSGEKGNEGKGKGKNG
jgi:membrane protein involved in colicin uptake